ncbi:NUDIX hydrolase N-terminal domain-containing protein [Deinococcus sp. 6YEL10]|uniref:NUDIX hydrolase N-terminal domain-containing protein n=1 Tax=Deinococcus sp. 6YEL10 TaxID=2745870 RepID=UPI001E4CB416|nr:NUDIX hydrolase N-terminal domain-containing protein [Deinococcus sp. 6YEL10]MCD0161954.1 NUDIX hydrolase N-terminal domain-containing protein [Deinococcus sp. 6YEL10]
MPTLAQLRELQAIAQEGLTYSRDPFDLTRFARLRDLTAELLAEQTGQTPATVTGLLRAEEGYLIRIPFVSLTIRDFTGLPAPRPEPA